MLKKLTGILILLSFFLVKSTPLFADDFINVNLISCSADSNGDETPEEAEKERQHMEISDEDFTQKSMESPGFLMLTKMTTFFNSPRINTPYISLPYPPPNGC